MRKGASHLQAEQHLFTPRALIFSVPLKREQCVQTALTVGHMNTGAELRDCGEESVIERDSLILSISAAVEMREEEDSSDLLFSLGP